MNQRGRLTYANVVATLALFLVLAGGSAFAVSQLGKNSVGSTQLKSNAVTTAKIKNGAVTPSKLSAESKAALTGPQGPKDERGEPGPAVQVLPSGQTETGIWAGGGG